MKKLLLLTLLAGLLGSCAHQSVQDKKINKLLSQLTLEEKISMIHGNTYFTTPPVERLGIPGFTLSDGPAGIREENNASDWGSAKWTNDSSAYFPCLTALASTWNPALATEFGKAYGEEAVIRNKFITLAPGINIHRTPLNGRNWEYLSEDPFLVTQFVPNIIKAVQKEGMASCVKHYALNNQEKDRNSINVEASERALREIYLPGFESAVKEGGALAVMGAYNKFRGQFCCQNSYLLKDILKDEWGFKGVVISDWDAAHSTMGAAENGLDIEMGTNKPFDEYYMAGPLLDSIRAGKIDSSVVNDKVRRILYVMSQLNMFNRPAYDTTGMEAKLATPERRHVSLAIAEEAIVLLKNDKNLLPLKLSSVKKIAVIGDNAVRKQSHGGGSTIIKARYEITPLEGIKNFVGDRAEVTWEPGYKYTHTGYNRYNPASDTLDSELLARAKKAAADADVVLFVGGLNHDWGLDCEGGDKTSLHLPYKQDEVIQEIMKVNPNTVVVLITGGPVTPGEWLLNAPALLETGYIGSETGTALANVLFGKTNPSGKLSDTWPKHLEDTPAFALGEYPGSDGTVHYNEGIFVGYRYYDSYNVEPLFPFGYGLSYTHFEYSDLALDKTGDHRYNVMFTIKNTGGRAGKETAEVYVSDKKSSLPRPVKELKGFSKIEIMPDSSVRVSVPLDEKSFSYYDPAKGWTLEPGEFEILVGASSRDIRLKGTVTE